MKIIIDKAVCNTETLHYRQRFLFYKITINKELRVNHWHTSASDEFKNKKRALPIGYDSDSLVCNLRVTFVVFKLTYYH